MSQKTISETENVPTNAIPYEQQKKYVADILTSARSLGYGTETLDLGTTVHGIILARKGDAFITGMFMEDIMKIEGGNINGVSIDSTTRRLRLHFYFYKSNRRQEEEGATA